jgi:hypothetical protein
MTTRGDEAAASVDNPPNRTAFNPSHDSFFLQRLKAFEYWVEETKTQLARLQSMRRDGFAWERIWLMVKTLLDCIYTIRVVEMQRMRIIHGMIDELVVNTRTIETMLRQFGEVEQVVQDTQTKEFGQTQLIEPDCQEGKDHGVYLKLSLKRGCNEGDVPKVKRRRLS